MKFQLVSRIKDKNSRGEYRERDFVLLEFRPLI